MRNLTISVAVVAVAASLVASSPASATGGGEEVSPVSVCGLWVFGGAFRNLSSARRQASKLWSNVYDLDRSNSPNAGRGLYVVATGPASSRSVARGWVRDMKNKGVRGAYMAHRCFYDYAL